RRRGRVAEGGGLLNRYTVNNRIGGSNPPVSAKWLIFKDFISGTDWFDRRACELKGGICYIIFRISVSGLRSQRCVSNVPGTGWNTTKPVDGNSTRLWPPTPTDMPKGSRIRPGQ